MGNEDTRQEFEGIVERLTADYPSLSRTGTAPWPRPLLLTVLIVGGVTWAFLSMAMVAWGWRGVVLTCSTVLAAIGAMAVRDYRWRTGR